MQTILDIFTCIPLFPLLFRYLFIVSQLFKDSKFNIVIFKFSILMCKLIMRINYHIAKLIKLNSFINNIIIDIYYTPKFVCELMSIITILNMIV